VLSEIETCNKEITSKEDEVLAIMEKMESQEKAMEEGKRSFALNQEEVKKRRAELQNQMEELGVKLQNLQSDRSRLLEGISSPLLKQYSRIAGARKGVALAEARDYSCQVCHVRLRPQMFNEVKKNEQIITCESCNRILYYAVNLS
jgi:predicted  nucleic acid-binding Zn-ribbon protein